MKYGDIVGYEVYNFNTTEYICSHHIDDDFIKQEILRNAIWGKCNYCESPRKKVVELSFVLRLIVVGLDCLFEDAIDSRNLNREGEHGYDGNTMTFYDLWFEDPLELNIWDGTLCDDIFRYLENTEKIYCYKSEYGDESDYLGDLWDLFKKTVIHKARYVFYFENQFGSFNLEDPKNILDKVQTAISEYNLFTEVNITKHLYRCRQHKDKFEIDEDGVNIASTPLEYAKTNNRMSPAGISMFYCSPYKDIAIKEVLDRSDLDKPFYTTAYFKSKRTLKLVDLSNIPWLPSIFDERNNPSREILSFLHHFAKDLSKSISNNDSIIEYIPTQIIIEYIRYNPVLGVDGIAYSSSKNPKKVCYVLFFDHERSLEELTFISYSIEVKRFRKSI